MKIKRLLIANRGEIAVRIIQAAKELGIETVAVYSDADRESLHAKLADQAFEIGPADSSQSYLNTDKLLDVAVRAKVDAIHPGYGFLSEKAPFAKAVQEAGFIFVGPSPAIIEKMGDKVAARETMEEAGLPIVPGTGGLKNLDDAEKAVCELLQERDDFSFPLLIKAAGGGGGKGMRICESEESLRSHLERAQSESRQAFGDDTLFVEKFIEEPRHIEVQILGDGKTTLHLFERECSLQRRHQKVIEEAPSPSLNSKTQKKILEAAVKAAHDLGYTSAGTIEFIVSPSDEFYFLEMNTRIQVEHPVTEEVTGVDLIKWQLKIASGEALDLRQSDIQLRGHAIEARLYAEDPDRGFLPQPGDLKFLRFPSLKGLRIDTGVESPTSITSYYDPMIAKLIGFGEDREAARQKLLQALKQMTLEGLVTNRAFLTEIMESPFFQKGLYHTKLLEDASWRNPPSASPEVLAAFCLKDYLENRPFFGGNIRSAWQGVASS